MSDKKYGLEEYRIMVEHQINDIQENRRHASLFLRIIVATAGIAAAVLSSTDILNFFVSIANSVNPAAAYQVVAGEVVGSRYFADMIVLGISISGVGLSVISLSNFVVYIPKFAYDAAKPKEIRFSPIPDYRTNNIAEDNKEDPVDLSEYKKAIEENRKILIKTRNDLDGCYKSAKKGLISGMCALLLWYSLSKSDPFLISIPSTVSFLLIYILFDSEYDIEEYTENIRLLPYTDIGAILVMSITLVLAYHDVNERIILTVVAIYSLQGLIGISSVEPDAEAAFHLLVWIGISIILGGWIVMTREPGDISPVMDTLIVGSFVIGFFGLFGRTTGRMSDIISKKVISTVSRLNPF